jgi:hypothetical protein
MRVGDLRRLVVPLFRLERVDKSIYNHRCLGDGLRG